MTESSRNSEATSHVGNGGCGKGTAAEQAVLASGRQVGSNSGDTKVEYALSNIGRI